MVNVINVVLGVLAIIPSLISLIADGGKHLKKAESYVGLRDALYPKGLAGCESDADRARYSELQLSIKYHLFQDELKSHHYPISNTMYFVQLISLSTYDAFLVSKLLDCNLEALTLESLLCLLAIIAVSALCLRIIVMRRVELQFDVLRNNRESGLQEFVSGKAVSNQAADMIIPILIVAFGCIALHSVGLTASIFIVFAISGLSVIVTLVHSVRGDSRQR